MKGRNEEKGREKRRGKKKGGERSGKRKGEWERKEGKVFPYLFLKQLNSVKHQLSASKFQFIHVCFPVGGLSNINLLI